MNTDISNRKFPTSKYMSFNMPSTTQFLFINKAMVLMMNAINMNLKQFPCVFLKLHIFRPLFACCYGTSVSVLSFSFSAAVMAKLDRM